MTASRNTDSRWLSWALRHDPAAAGIRLDHGGWVAVAELLEAASRHGHAMSRSDLDALVATNDKRRFALSEDGSMIRANQGHSVAVDLGLEAQVPPPLLYHGTAERFLAGIMSAGLAKMARQHVHLSAERSTAMTVGVRHGRPVILVVAAGQMHADGHAFFRSHNGVWLVDAVPITYLCAEQRDLGQP